VLIEVGPSDVLREPKIGERGLKLDAYGKFAILSCKWLLNSEGSCTCTFLGKDNCCEIYQSRPEVCVNYQAGSDDCQSLRRKAGLAPLVAVSRASTDENRIKAALTEDVKDY
jgi:Fe-S-cluster containining protein